MCHRSIQLNKQQCSEPRPQTAPAKATGRRQEYYHDFEVPFAQNILMLGTGADGAAGAVFRDTARPIGMR